MLDLNIFNFCVVFLIIYIFIQLKFEIKTFGSHVIIIKLYNYTK